MVELMVHSLQSQPQNQKLLIIIQRELSLVFYLVLLHNFETMLEMLLLEEAEVEQVIIMVQAEMVEAEEVEEVVAQEVMVETSSYLQKQSLQLPILLYKQFEVMVGMAALGEMAEEAQPNLALVVAEEAQKDLDETEVL